MSQAFVKESDDNELLHQIKPTIQALVNYFKADNNYTPVFVKQIIKAVGTDVIVMNNGLSYFVNIDNYWEMCL